LVARQDCILGALVSWAASALVFGDRHAAKTR
jgi:hypothetical protein